MGEARCIILLEESVGCSGFDGGKGDNPDVRLQLSVGCRIRIGAYLALAQ